MTYLLQQPHHHRHLWQRDVNVYRLFVYVTFWDSSQMLRGCYLEGTMIHLYILFIFQPVLDVISHLDRI